MSNPFDKTFFKLLAGFVFMLGVALLSLFFVRGYSVDKSGVTAKTDTTKTEAIKVVIPKK